ncbi:formate dehydrogenase [Saccharothrix sp. ALI-22-I]|uniref:formate dehydrogenase subunit delta n=1 Tax=Saccharothrix sp. ALI-22-I TaxID=1933778 RepID=UPI00097BB4EE|nr:formate dehydrogenase subunit delta [Saccharothrix sp. ALI-22-I]ONI87141.1 formate dehydrogenase [Saccharothrix sp. ALI-22-I]
MSGTTPPTVRLANEIARQFHHQPPDTAATAIATHIERFWDPRMRTDLQHHATTAPESLDPVALAAAKLVGS